MTSETRAQRLLDEFDEGAASAVNYSTRHGIAAVLRHLADTDGDWDSEPARVLRQHADALTAPTLLLRATRRPKPPSLKTQALKRLESLEKLAEAMGHDFDDTIRRALAALSE